MEALCPREILAAKMSPQAWVGEKGLLRMTLALRVIGLTVQLGCLLKESHYVYSKPWAAALRVELSGKAGY